MPDDLRSRIKALSDTAPDALNASEADRAVRDLISALNDGSVRSASRQDDGAWVAHPWVKQGILLGFKVGTIIDYSTDGFPYFDKHTYPLKPVDLDHKIRIVPGGSSIRTGSYVAPGVVCMPPMYINVGAYVDEGTMVDSHALVGSCAQIGKQVHLSAAVQIGGVLEPVNATPVVIEDDVFVGGGCGVYEGCVVHEGAVLAPGVQLTASTRLYDTVEDAVHTGSNEAPLEVPPRAVVVPGSRRIDSDFGQEHGLSLYAPVIVKYRDAKTNAATALEEALR